MPNPEYGGYKFQPSTVPMQQSSGNGMAGSVLSQAGGLAMSSGAPPLMIAGAAMQGAGLLANIYGAYQQDKATEEAARENQRRFDLQMKMQQQQRDDQLKQQDFSNDISSGQYAQDYRQNLDSAYGNYYTRNRM